MARVTSVGHQNWSGQTDFGNGPIFRYRTIYTCIWSQGHVEVWCNLLLMKLLDIAGSRKRITSDKKINPHQYH